MPILILYISLGAPTLNYDHEIDIIYFIWNKKNSIKKKRRNGCVTTLLPKFSQIKCVLKNSC
jgi:hypothetical protein